MFTIWTMICWIGIALVAIALVAIHSVYKKFAPKIRKTIQRKAYDIAGPTFRRKLQMEIDSLVENSNENCTLALELENVIKLQCGWLPQLNRRLYKELCDEYSVPDTRAASGIERVYHNFDCDVEIAPEMRHICGILNLLTENQRHMERRLKAGYEFLHRVNAKIRYTIKFRRENRYTHMRLAIGTPKEIQVQPGPGNTTRAVALLIDSENIQATYAQDILRVASQLGNCAEKRIYGNSKKWKKTGEHLGLQVMDVPQNVPGKNASDIALVVDAMVLLQSEKFTGFIIVSSDSDLTALATHIGEKGKFVAVMGSKTTPVSLRKACDKFILLEKIRYMRPSPQKAFPLLRKALELSLVEADGEWTSLSRVGQNLRNIYPNFNHRDYKGSPKTLKALVEKIPEFELKLDKGQVHEMRLKNV